MPGFVTITLNRLLPTHWLQHKKGDSRFSRVGWPRWVDYDYDEMRWRTHATQTEWLAWAKEHMPNGYCICYPERDIVCGQHSR